MSKDADDLEQLRSALEALSERVESLERRLNAPPTPNPQRQITQAQPERKQALESRLGLTLVNRIGAITLAIGIIFFFKYAVDNRWLTPFRRVALGVLAGLLLIYIAEWLRRKGQSVFAQGVCGCGLTVLYISLYASFAFYQLFPQAATFVLMVAVSILAATLSLFRYGGPAIAAHGLIGGFLTPPLLNTRGGHPALAFSYVLLLDVAASAIALRRRWSVLHGLAFAGTAGVVLFWLVVSIKPEIGTGLLFLIIFFALFFGVSVRWLKMEQNALCLWVLACSAFWAICTAEFLLNIEYSDGYTIPAFILAAAYFIAAHFLQRENAHTTLYVIGHACVWAAVFRGLDAWANRFVALANRGSFLSETVSIFLALYAIGMIVSGVLRSRVVDRIIGLIALGVVVTKLYLYDVWHLTRFYRISAFVILGILLLSASYLYSRFKSRLDSILSGKDDHAQ